MELIEIDDKILDKAIYLFGNDAQIEMIEEECLELALAIQKFKRIRGNPQDKYDNLIDEIADVTIMIKQAHKIFPIGLINERIDFKMKRLEKRLIEKVS